MLALPGVLSLTVVALLIRIPATMGGITLTLHVVLGLDRGYGAAGLVSGVLTVGAAVGAPLLGRLVDRRGLRPVLVLTTSAAGVFWFAVPVLPYHGLLVAALLGGLLSIPIFSVIRQSLAALVPEEYRKAAYSVDSMSAELSFMVGPALAVLVATQVSSRVAAMLVGGCLVLAGAGLWRLNPPVRSAAEEERATPGERLRRRAWLRPRLVAVLFAGLAATIVLAGTDVGVVAVLRDAGEVGWSGLVLALWSAYSLAGGFVFGAIRHSPHPLVLAGLLGAATIPLGLATGWIGLALLLIPAGALCAPTLAAVADAVSRLVPAQARGEAMGLYGSAMTIGMALGAPLAGAVADRAGAGWSFVAVGTVGVLLALAGLAASGREARGGSWQGVPADHGLPADGPAQVATATADRQPVPTP